MNPAQLLAQFEKVADAPDAVPRLRDFILDLAVRGKLVPQDPNDEPALDLLKRIAKEKERLVKAGMARKSEIDPIAITEEPFPTPSTWVWTRLGSVGDWGSGSTPPRGRPELYNGGITWLKSGELNDNRKLTGSEETVTETALKECSFRVNQPGDVLIAMYGATIGKVAILSEKAVTNQAVCGCTPFSGVFNDFLFLFLLSQREQFHSASEGGAQPNISKVKIVWTPFPLPPLAEQHRIVARVDELMMLCDQLEVARSERESRRDRLSAASLARLNTPSADSFNDDARFALDVLPSITARHDQVKQLRQTILNLAVRGKLVVQDAGDEPASKLLKRIAADKARLITEEKIKKEKEVDPITEEALPFEIPKEWEWVRLDSLCQLITKGSSPKWQGVSYVDAGKGLLFVTSENVGNYELRKLDDLKYVESRFADIEPRSMLKSGDILMNLVGASIGRTAIYHLDLPANINQAVSLIRLVDCSKGMCVRYLLHYFNSPSAVAFMLGSRVTTAQPNMSLTNAREFPVPIPPLAEQRRIVAKVNELMGLCDRLEASLSAGAERRSGLLTAVLGEALRPAEERDEAA